MSGSTVPPATEPGEAAGLLPSGTVTLLFTDIEGSTRLLQRLGDRYPDVLADHHRLLRDAVRRHEGVEVGTEGDSFFFVFGRARDALAAAIAGQQALASHDWSEGSTVRVRMGLHTGEPDKGPDGYVGYDVHRAARISSCAHGGQIVLSSVTRELLEVPVHVAGFIDLGEHWLKDLADPEHLYQVTADGLASRFPALRSLAEARTNLPGQLTSFVGRDRDLEQLKSLITEYRLVTLSGPGGAGKTRLALRAAGELLHQFGDGVWLVRLAGVASAQLVDQAIVETMGLRDTGNQPAVEVIAEYSRGRRLLLLLDNFEHLMPAADLVGELVESSAGIHALVTSREVLNLQGEQEMVVPPMLLPPRDHPIDLGPLSQIESVRLFVDRAYTVMPDFELTDANAAAVAEICRGLEGLPLAIELAAARVKVMSPEAMVARLGRPLSLLTGGSRDLPERQRTLRATIEWSYGMLTDDERILLGRLTAFYAAIDLETVEAVCAWDDVDVLAILAQLVDKSLMRRIETPGGEVLFWMLETVKEFAREKLRGSGGQESAADRHADHYRELAEQASTELLGRRQLSWLERIERDQDNFTAAIAWSLDSSAWDRAAAISEGVHVFWWIRGQYGSGRFWLRRVLEGVISDPVLRAKLLVANARLASDQGEFEEAHAGLVEAESIGRDCGDDAVVARALSEIAALRIRRREENTEESVAQALEIFRRLGDISAEAELLIRIASLSLLHGDSDSAMKTTVQALSLMRFAGNSWGVAAALNNIGFMIALEERFYDALPFLAESRDLFETVGTKEGLASVVDTQALIAAGLGDTDKAIDLYEQSVELFREICNRPAVAMEQVHLGRITLEQGQLDNAAECLLEGLQIAQEYELHDVSAFAFEGIAALLLRTDRAEEAAELFAAAQLFRENAGVPLAPVDRNRLDRDMSLLADQIDPTTLDSASARGRDMSLADLHAAALAALQAAAAI